jgi:hypothetical protein
MPQHLPHPHFAVAEHRGDFDLYAWLHSAAPGACIEYHRGFLAIDRTRNLSALDEPRRKRCAAVAGDTYAAATQNLVCLIQRRLGPGAFSYIAVAR